MAPGGGSSSRGGAAGEGRCHLVGGDGGSWPANAGPGMGLGGTCQTGGSTLSGGWAEPAIYSYAGSAATVVAT